MDIKEIMGAMEAILFASGEPVAVQKLVSVLSLDADTCDKLIRELGEKYSGACGIRLLRLEKEVQLCSNEAYAEYVRPVLESRRNLPLSNAAMEVLAVIAYNQPVTKSFIEQVRGVDCSGVIGSLQQKNLIEEKGRLELPGRPLIYGTTPDFLRCMGISSLTELPELPKEETEETEATA